MTDVGGPRCVTLEKWGPRRVALAVSLCKSRLMVTSRGGTEHRTPILFWLLLILSSSITGLGMIVRGLNSGFNVLNTGIVGGCAGLIVVAVVAVLRQRRLNKGHDLSAERMR